MKQRTFRFILVIIISVLSGYYVGVNKIRIAWNNYQPQVVITSKEPPPSVSNVDFSLMWKVLDQLEGSYYDKTAIDPAKILHGAITGMVESLDDPYTVYLPPTQNDDFKQALAGKFEGIGAELGMKDKQIIIVSPLDGSPAKKAGLRSGDAIIKVGDDTTLGWTLNQAVEKIRGPKGTAITLSIVNQTSPDLKEVKIIRDTITVNSVKYWSKSVKDIEEVQSSKILKPFANQKVAYIRLSQFGDTANNEWAAAVAKLTQEIQRDGTVKGVVVDLRNNPGGYLTHAVFIASEFIKGGNVVIQEDASGQKEPLTVSRPGNLTSLPVVVLINKGSASASEIVAGAIRDHKRGKLVGETSFGKGTIQDAKDLGGGAGLHVTVAKWLTPNGVWIHKKGLEPDIIVELSANDASFDPQLEKAIQQVVQ